MGSTSHLPWAINRAFVPSMLSDPREEETTMRISIILAAIGFAFSIASALLPATADAFPKCAVKDCARLTNSPSRSELHAACDEAGGIATGTNTRSGPYACMSPDDKGGWVECDAKGQCIGGGGTPARQRPGGVRQELKSILGTQGGKSPARK
jgi:hypothetical protein